MKLKVISQILVLALAVIAGIVAARLIETNAWGIIILYWITLTVKNVIDFVGTLRK